mmetsp:Transcript_136926/g.193688  ORF Transcript_136926/g.193688 Transcript_136926/m.193688 type:complete len:240 (-) Transcript_136926:717-1436(-)
MGRRRNLEGEATAVRRQPDREMQLRRSRRSNPWACKALRVLHVAANSRLESDKPDAAVYRGLRGLRGKGGCQLLHLPGGSALKNGMGHRPVAGRSSVLLPRMGWSARTFPGGPPGLEHRKDAVADGGSGRSPFRRRLSQVLRRGRLDTTSLRELLCRHPPGQHSKGDHRAHSIDPPLLRISGGSSELWHVYSGRTGSARVSSLGTLACTTPGCCRQELQLQQVPWLPPVESQGRRGVGL